MMPPTPVDIAPRGRRCGRPLRRLLVGLALVLPYVRAGADAPVSAPPEPPAATTLVVGLTSAERRFVTGAEAEKISQYEAALAVEVARTQGMRVAFQLAPFDELLRDLAEGRIDTIPGMARTPERLKDFDFTVAHNRMNTHLFVRRGETRIKSVADLAGKRVLVVGGSYSQRWLETQSRRPEILPVADLTAAVRQLDAGAADCLIAKQINIFAAMRAVGIRDIVIAGPPIEGLQQDLHFGVRAGNRVLLAQLNEALFSLKNSGELDALYERWLGILNPSANWLNRHARPLAAATLALLVVFGAAWLVQRMKTSRAQHRLAEIERRVAKRTEELAAAKARFEAVFANTPAGIVLFDPDDRTEAGRIVDCNEMTCRLYGRTRAELVGRSFSQLWAVPPSPADWARELAEVRRQSHRRTHAQHRRSDGTVLEMEFFTTSIHLDGRALLLAIGLDIGDRLRAEAALRRTEEFQRLVLQASNDGIFEWEIAADRFVISERGRQLLGLADSVAIARRRDWWQHLHRDDAAAAETVLQRHLADGTPFVHTARFRHRDGSDRWLYGRAHTRCDDRGIPHRMVGCYTDITELKRIDDELQLTRRLRAVGELVGGIAHEFNNLLTPILLQTSLLADETGTTAEQALQLQPVLDAARRARSLTQQLLQFGRQNPAERQPRSLAAVIESTISLVRSTIDRRIEIVTRCEPALPPLLLNDTVMGQVVMNLVLNARDAFADYLARPPAADWHARIEISLGRHTGGIPPRIHDASARSAAWQCLRVRDNGPGIPSALHARIFEPFFTTKEVGKGTGLGLAMVWNSVEEHGGWIDIDSEEGRGTEFFIYLPGDPALALRATPDPASVPATTRHPRRRLLLVDDDPLVGESIAGLLRKLGYETLWLRDGTEALQRLAPGAPDAPDALVTDLNMAGLGGEDLVERARHAGYRGKIIVVSGNITRQAEQRLQAAGIERLVAKPFEFHQLESLLAGLWKP